jgi:hypothetical protein
LALVPFKNAEDIGDRFLELLADLGTDVSTAIQAEHDFLSGTAAVEAWRSPKNFPRRVILNTNCKQPLACTA